MTATNPFFRGFSLDATWTSPDGSVRLFLADCMDILPFVQVDAVVTDPPYGIWRRHAHKQKSRGRMAKSKDHGHLSWDDEPCSEAQLAAMRAASRWQVIFGGNYFALPPSSCWLVWDKLNGDTDFADCELAWTNLPKAVRRIQWRWHGMIREGQEERFHPTQKPEGVMDWCISHLPDVATICDPFMGSGTTGVAAVKRGKGFVGIEREPSYFEVARNRIQEAMGMEVPRKDGSVQKRLFIGQNGQVLGELDSHP